jgi:membrane-bound metal-dependent hydrolase YbcI (DUF457 family)
MILAWPIVRRRVRSSLSSTRRILLAGLVLLSLMAPDLDLVQCLWGGMKVTDLHNYFSHSVFVAPLFAIPFAFLCRWVAGGSWVFYAAFACLAYWSHIFLDAATWGRGVQMFWPLADGRFSTPYPLFYGVRHSVGAPWWAYLITVANDVGFGLLLWLIARRWWMKGSETVSSRHAPQMRTPS